MDESRKQNSLDPVAIFDQVDIALGAQAADFGCGAGFFSLELARRVGRNGHVWALDVLPQALESVESLASQEGIDQIESRRVNLERLGGSKLEDASQDIVVVKDMLFQNGNQKVIIEEAHRVLKPGAKLLIIEWSIESLIGPEKKLRVSRDGVRSLLGETFFESIQEIEAGNTHYGFLAIRKSRHGA